MSTTPTSKRISTNTTIAQATLRLLSAMEQRQRRFVMENFRSGDADVDLSSFIFSHPPTTSNASKNINQKMFANLKQTSSLQYIIDAVDEAEREALRDPDNFPFYTLVLT